MHSTRQLSGWGNPFPFHLKARPRRTFCKQQRILSLHSFLYHPIPQSPLGTQVYWCLLMAMNADIRSESFRHSLSHAQTLSSGGNRCRKLQWTLLRAVLWGFPTGQTKKGERYARETNKADGTLNSCYFCFLYTNYRKKKEKKKTNTTPTPTTTRFIPKRKEKEKKEENKKGQNPVIDHNTKSHNYILVCLKNK